VPSNSFIGNVALGFNGTLSHFKSSRVYNAMGALPRKTVEMLTMLTSAEVEDVLKYKRIFLIEDVNSKQMVGSASVSFLNSTSTIATVGYIDDITIRRKYESAELREELINYVTDVCVSQDNCIKCMCK